jgi:IS5 family transposase
MAAGLGLSGHDQLQRVIASPAWDDGPLWRVLAEEADLRVGGPEAMLVIGDTALPKTGTLSVGVTQQYLEQVLPPEPGDIYADSAFTGGPAERLIIGRGGRPRTAWTGIRGRSPEALARLDAHNAAVRRVRCRIEKVFGTWRRSYGLGRMRWLGLAKAGLQVRLAAMAYNLRRTITLLQVSVAV